jgi:hypothetical protein
MDRPAIQRKRMKKIACPGGVEEINKSELGELFRRLHKVLTNGKMVLQIPP